MSKSCVGAPLCPAGIRFFGLGPDAAEAWPKASIGWLLPARRRRSEGVWSLNFPINALGEKRPAADSGGGTDPGRGISEIELVVSCSLPARINYRNRWLAMSADDLNLSLDPTPDENDFVDVELDESNTNRPADGARQATPGEVLFEGFSGSEDAGDFLGLDTELHFSNDSGGHGHVDTAGAAAETGADLGLGSSTSSYPAETHSEESEESAAYEGEYDEDDYDEEDEYEDEAAEGEYGEVGGPHKGVLILSALTVGALVVVGALFGPGLIEQYTGVDESAVATTSGTTPRAGGATVIEPGAGTETNAGDASMAAGSTSDSGTSTAGSVETGTGGETGSEDPFFASADGAVTPPVKNGERGSLQRLFSSGSFDLVPRETSIGASRTGATNTTVAQRDTPIDTIPDIAVSSDVAIPFPGVGVDSTGPGEDIFTAGMDWASTGDVDVVWRRDEIPMDAIDAPTRVATPRVGSVRLYLEDGNFFEGKLLAMGEGHVWIQTAPGRMALAGEQIASIEPLGFNSQDSNPGAVSAPLRGERVRVRAPGGVIYGHVVSQSEEGSVTLRTDSGGKVTMANAEIEAIGNARAVIVEN